ncbi:hypothetical protein ABMY87_15200, partial [Pseudomonas aeruginosa]|uniref:hypothetical protein n=1 Tax=Pseudomonas aeruginosa TaxID=287 RepID=UPI0039E1D29E
QGLFGASKKSAGFSQGNNTKIAQIFATPVQKCGPFSRSPLGVCSLAFYPQLYPPKSCTMAFGL